MKLYATTISERASKGQGGNKRLEITLQGGKYRDILIRFELLIGDGEQLPFYTKIIDGDINFLINLKSNISFFIDKQTKDKKQKSKCNLLRRGYDVCDNTNCNHDLLQ